jgi:hypothetical protein
MEEIFMLAQLSVNESLRDNYIRLVDGLDLRAKSELLLVLANEIAESALKASNRSEKEVVYELAGSWKDDRTAEEMVADMYSSRMSNRRILESIDD